MRHPKQKAGGCAPQLPSPDYLQRWDEQVVALQKKNADLRASLVVTRTILVQLRPVTETFLHELIDTTVSKIDEALQ